MGGERPAPAPGDRWRRRRSGRCSREQYVRRRGIRTSPEGHSLHPLQMQGWVSSPATVGEEGLEPSRSFEHGLLKPASRGAILACVIQFAGPTDTVSKKCSDEVLMTKGEGKGWAKGRTAASDPRTARAAAAHTGKAHVRRKPLTETTWVRATYTTLPIEWSEAMAYIVGLTATDGCLGTRARAITFTSADRQLVETYRQLLGRSNKIGTMRTKAAGTAYRIHFKDARLSAWFRSVGLTPRKSLTIGTIDVPDEFLGAARVRCCTGSTQTRLHRACCESGQFGITMSPATSDGSVNCRLPFPPGAWGANLYVGVAFRSRWCLYPVWVRVPPRALRLSPSGNGFPGQ